MAGVHGRAHHALQLLVAAALAVGILAAVPGTGRATTGELAYTCDYSSVLPDQDAVARSVTATVDTDAPGASPIGAALAISTTVRLTMPAATYAALAEAVPGLDTLRPTSDRGVQESYIGPDGSVFPMAAHPELKLAAAPGDDPVFAGKSGAPNAVSPGPKTPGSYTITVGAMTFLLTAGSTATAYAVTCTPTSGSSTVVDTLTATDTTTIALGPLPPSWVYGGPNTTTATVTRTPPPATPDNPAPPVPGTWPALTGAVELRADGEPVGDPVPLRPGGTATLSLGGVPRGTHELTAVYLPDSVSPYLTSTADGGTVSVDVTTTTVLAVMPVSAEVGDLAIATATVTGNDGSPASGEVSFTLDSDPVGSAVLTDGVGTVHLPTRSAGHHAVAATYAGDGPYEPSVSEPRYLGVNLHATSIVLSLGPRSASFGEPVTATAVVTSAYDGLEGTVKFTLGRRSVSAALVDGTARAVLPSLAPGAHEVVARFRPSVGEFRGSTSTPVRYTVLRDPSWITQTIKKAKHGRQLRCSFAVHTAHGSPASGVVRATLTTHGRTVRSRTALLALGRAAIRLRAPRGHWSLVATYSGSGTVGASTAVKRGHSRR